MPRSRGFAFDVAPCGNQPTLHLFFSEHGKGLLHWSGRTVSAASSEKKNVLYIVFDDCPRLVWFTVKASAISLYLCCAVGNLEPQDRSKTIQTQLACSNLKIGVQGKYVV